MAVNSGIKNAVKMLQKLLKTSIDGIVGTQTLTALKNTQEKEMVYLNYYSARKNYYRRIASGRKRKFLGGWLKRVLKTSEYFYSHIKMS